MALAQEATAKNPKIGTGTGAIERPVARPRKKVGDTAKVLGIGLLVAGLSIWFLPVDAWMLELPILKLLLSLSFGFMGLALLQSSQRKPVQDVEFDTDAEVIRILVGRGSSQRMEAAYSFSEIVRVEQFGNLVRLWDARDEFVADVRLEDPIIRDWFLKKSSQAI